MIGVTMADVLADHKLDATLYLITEQEYVCICGRRSTNHEVHQERALSAAGFGHIWTALDDKAEQED